MNNSFFCFKNKETGKYYAPSEDVADPEKAYPKLGDRGSAFMYADERFEGQLEAKINFKRKYEMVEIERRNPIC